MGNTSTTLSSPSRSLELKWYAYFISCILPPPSQISAVRYDDGMIGPVVTTLSNVYQVKEKGQKWQKLFTIHPSKAEQVQHFLIGPLSNQAEGHTIVLGHKNGEIRLIPTLNPSKMRLIQAPRSGICFLHRRIGN